jgi:glycosyltransferase involved in cell wall biosynthesis
LTQKVSVIIPARDEAKSIGKLISKTKMSLVKSEFEIIVINDGSKDNTEQIAKSNGAIVVSHVESMGKGAAMKTGAAVATGGVLVFFDGDGAHNPDDIPNMLSSILQNKADLVVGSRDFRGSKTIGAYMPRRITNGIASFMTSIIISLLLPLASSFACPVKWIEIEDAECGFKAIRKEKWLTFNLISQGFEIESEIIYEAAKNRLAICNVPVSCNWDCRVSRLSIFKDGLKTIRLLSRKLITELGTARKRKSK